MSLLRKIAFAVSFTLYSSLSFSATTDEIIGGFSEFLVERANANLVASFERKLKKDENFQCYFQNTHQRINNLSLQNLFTSKGYWEQSVRDDLELLLYKTFLSESQRAISSFRNNFILTTQFLEYEYEGQSYSIDYIDLSWNENLKNQINGFTFEIETFLENFDSSIKNLDGCELSTVQANTLRSSLKNLITKNDSIEKWSTHFKNYGGNLRIKSEISDGDICKVLSISSKDCKKLLTGDDQALTNLLTNITSQLDSILLIISNVRDALNTFNRIDSELENKLKMLELFYASIPNSSSTRADLTLLLEKLDTDESIDEQYVKTFISNQLSELSTDNPDFEQKYSKVNSIFIEVLEHDRSLTDQAYLALELLNSSGTVTEASYTSLSKYITFFTSIADSSDKSDVKNILEQYTMPPVSFGEKRKKGQRVFISSYFGVMVSTTENSQDDSDSDEPAGNLFIPVGIEYSAGHGKSAISVMLSPFDFAYPISLQLQDQEEDYQLKHIVSPSLTLSYGLPSQPINAGLGIQGGQSYDDSEDYQTRYFFFLSLDLPMMRLF